MLMYCHIHSAYDPVFALPCTHLENSKASQEALALFQKFDPVAIGVLHH